MAEPIAVAKAGALSFGSFVAGSGGFVSVNAYGSRTKSGGVFLVSQGAAVSAAQFNVSGTPGAGYTITLPDNGVVSLSNGNGDTMAVKDFLSFPSGTGTLSGGGSQILNVGATLTVGNNQAPGAYSGAYSVTVNYQ